MPRILANKKKSIIRGLQPRHPYATRPLLVSCYGFKIVDDLLRVPLGNRRYLDVPPNGYVRKILSEPLLKIHSFTLTVDSVIICYSKEIAKIECASIEGVDRNLRNLTVGTRIT